jgi:DNA-binding CsgD family transcriptional regulator
VYLLQSLTDVFILALKPIIIISLFTKETAIKAVILIYTIRPIVEVILEKSGISLSFIGFNAYIVVVSLCYLYFFCHLPKKVWPRYVYKGDELVPPRMLLVGICILLLLSTVIVLFSETVVQSVPSGHTVLDLSVVLSFVVLYVLWKRIGINPFRSGSVLVSLGVLGFLGVVLSSYIPASIIPAIVLISAGKVIQGINASYSGIILMERYPSRFTLPIIMISAIVALVTHYLIYYALKDNMQFLYLIYLLVTVVLAMLYFVLSPYLIHFMRSNIGTKRVEVKGSQPITPSNDTLSILTEYAFDKLARYEIEIAELIMQGYSNPEMAKIMRITENTVKSYRKNLYSKLQIHSRRELFELIERGGR